MVAVNPIDREIQLKIVYYGPGLGGKTTTLQHIHETTVPEHRGKMVSLATPVDRTLYFDYLPVRLPDIGGYTLKLQLFTVPGQVHFNATRKLVLSNADGVVFVADSQTSRMDANLESFDNLLVNLSDYKIDTESFPIVFQYNKQDLDHITPTDELNARINKKGRPFLGTCAIRGENIYESLELVTKEVLRDLKRRDVLARGTSKQEDVADNPIAFKRRNYGLSERLQDYSENTVRYPMEDSLKEVSEKLFADNEDKPEPKEAGTSHPPHPVDRPTIPAPLALNEKSASDHTARTSAHDSKVPSDAAASKAAVSSFTFSFLWPKAEREHAVQIEHTIVKRRYREVITLVKEELDRVIAIQRKGVPHSSETTILALLGLDGREYLEISRLNVTPPSEPVSRERALAAYLFLLQAVERSK